MTQKILSKTVRIARLFVALFLTVKGEIPRDQDEVRVVGLCKPRKSGFVDGGGFGKNSSGSTAFGTISSGFIGSLNIQVLPIEKQKVLGQFLILSEKNKSCSIACRQKKRSSIKKLSISYGFATRKEKQFLLTENSYRPISLSAYVIEQQSGYASDSSVSFLTSLRLWVSTSMDRSRGCQNFEFCRFPMYDQFRSLVFTDCSL